MEPAPFVAPPPGHDAHAPAGDEAFEARPVFHLWHNPNGSGQLWLSLDLFGTAVAGLPAPPPHHGHERKETPIIPLNPVVAMARRNLLLERQARHAATTGPTITVDLYDPTGRHIPLGTATVRAGRLHRTIDPPQAPAQDQGTGHAITTGIWTVRVTAGHRVYTERLAIAPPPFHLRPASIRTLPTTVP